MMRESSVFPDPRPQISRRQFTLTLTGICVAGLSRHPLAQTQAVSPSYIDCHHHFYRNTTRGEQFLSRAPTPQPLVDYTPSQSIEAMDKAGVRTALISCPVSFGDNPDSIRDDAVALCRELNEFGARMVADYKRRFRLLAMLPLFDIDASLREIEYAFTTLKASGVGLVTNYGGRYLGDAAFEPVFDELNRRGAIVHSHPVDGPCCHEVLPGVLPQRVEWNTDTSRAMWSILNVASNGVSRATQYQNVKFVWSHAGGSLLGLVGRFLGPGADVRGPAEPNSALHHLRRFYYDSAGSANAVQMQGLKSLVGISQVVLGSDFPFTTNAILSTVRALQHCGLTDEELLAINRQNALQLVPDLSTVA